MLAQASALIFELGMDQIISDLFSDTSFLQLEAELRIFYRDHAVTAERDVAAKRHSISFVDRRAQMTDSRSGSLPKTDCLEQCIGEEPTFRNIPVDDHGFGKQLG
jgi:hypothetical protein